MKEKLIVIIGPTAVGKTKVSIELAKALNGEVISGDSMQIYRSMDIGTAKVTEEEMEGIPHHLIDIKDPTEPFSVAEFQQLAKGLITEINRKGKVPIIAGGTGLYIQSVLYDYNFSDASADEEYRNQLEQLVQEKGNDFLHEKLAKIDKESAQSIHPNNKRRVIRALEVYHKTGLTLTEYQQQQSKEARYDVKLIGLTMDRKVLYERINKRVDLMMSHGLLEEVQKLYNKGIKDCQSIQAIGYKELYEYLDGSISKEEAVEALKQNSRRYAKRQLTWFRNKMDVEWFDMTSLDYQSIIQEILRFIAGKSSKKAK